MDDLRYPIGPFKREGKLEDKRRKELIEQIAAVPAKLRDAVSGLSPEQLETPYRPDGWTVRQVVHHVVDSHLNAYIRFKLALTENKPRIKTYNEKLWAELPDARSGPVETSLTLLEALHERWVTQLRAMTTDDFARTLDHPEHGAMVLDDMLCLYGWHGRHHAAHVTSLRARRGWN